MIINEIRSCGMSLAISVLLVGCASVNRPTQLPLHTIGSSETPSPRASSTDTLTPAFMPIPTLPSDEAYTGVEELLMGSPTCRLPCWMGFTPGQSTFEDARTQLLLFSGIARRLFIEEGADKWSSGSFTIPYLDDNMAVEVSPFYLTSSDGNTISIISFETRSYRVKNGEWDGDVYGFPPYGELLKAYTLFSVLTDYGPPAQINVYAGLDRRPGTPAPWDHFDIHLWYPELGIFMEFKTSVEGVGDNYRICPSNALISGYLLEPNLTISYQDVLKGLAAEYRDIFSSPVYVKTIEDGFGMTIDEFYQLFRSPTDRCLETPISIWWPH
jgi:hypothetical protein